MDGRGCFLRSEAYPSFVVMMMIMMISRPSRLVSIMDTCIWLVVFPTDTIVGAVAARLFLYDLEVRQAVPSTLFCPLVQEGPEGFWLLVSEMGK